MATIDKKFILVVDLLEKRDIGLDRNIFFNKEDSNTAYVQAEIKNGIEVVDLTDCEISFSVKKANGGRSLAGGNIIDAKNGIIELPFTSEMLNFAGLSTFQITIRDGIKSSVSNFFYFVVNEAIVSGQDIEDSEDFPLLVKLQKDAIAVIEEHKKATLRMETLEIENKKSENERIDNENIRIDSEKDRVRVEKERVNEEEKRNQGFIERSNAIDKSIKYAEDLNVQIDDTKEFVTKGEEKRDSQEKVRIENENKRIETENERINEENKRIKQEKERVLKENERIATEGVRGEKESHRVQNEEQRVRQELERIENEKNRLEKGKEQDSWFTTKAEEILVNLNKTESLNSETKEFREEVLKGEETRNINEKSRKEQEQTRVNQELERVESEKKRLLYDSEIERIKKEIADLLEKSKAEIDESELTKYLENKLLEKADKVHIHELSEIVNFPKDIVTLEELEEKLKDINISIEDIDLTEINNKIDNKAEKVHTHNSEDIVDLKIFVDENVSSKADKDHRHDAIDITGLDEKIRTFTDSKAESSHIHKVDSIEGIDAKIKSYTDSKVEKIHNHNMAEITDLPKNLITSDVLDEKLKGLHSGEVDLSEIEDKISKKAEIKHNHQTTDIVGLDKIIEDKTSEKAEKVHVHNIKDISDFPKDLVTKTILVEEIKKLAVDDLKSKVEDKAEIIHTHEVKDISDLSILTDKYATKEELEKAKLEGKDIDLSGYAKTVHTHDISEINNLDKEFQKYQLKETFEKNVIDLIDSEYKKHKTINGNKCVGIHHSDFLTILKYCKTLNIDNPTGANLFYNKLESKPIFEEFLLNNPSCLFYDNGKAITEFDKVIDVENPYTLIYVDLDKLEVAGTQEALLISMALADENINTHDLLVDTKIDSIIRFLDEEFRDMGESINTITNELSSLI